MERPAVHVKGKTTYGSSLKSFRKFPEIRHLRQPAERRSRGDRSNVCRSQQAGFRIRGDWDIQLPDENAEIEPVPTTGGGGKQPPELDNLSNILKTFNDQFGNVDWTDKDRVRRLITEEIPAKVAVDTAYQNAKKHSDKQNARIEHDKALARVIVNLMQDDTELFKQFSDNEGFKRWLAETVFGLTYDGDAA